MTKVKEQKKNQPKTAWRTWRYYWQELKRYKWHTLACFLLTPVVVFIRAVLAPMIFADLIEKATLGLPAEEMWAIAATEIILFGLVFAASKMLLEPLRLWACWKMEILAIYDLASLGFDTVAAQSMQFHNDRFSGSLVSQTNKFVWAFERLIDVIVWDLWPMVVYILMVVITLANQAWWFALGLVVFVVVYAVVAFFSYRKMMPLNEAEAEAENKQTGQLADSISNIISVKSYAHEAHEEKRFVKAARHTYEVSRGLMHASIGRDVKFGLVQVGITAMILVFLVAGREWLGVSVSTLVLIVTYAQSIQGELWNFTHIFKNWNRAFGDAHEMTLILDMVDDVVDAPDAAPLEMDAATVKFDNVKFQHKDAKSPIFEDFDLEIEPGERVGLVGVSGSGKTTLTKLLLRFADVSDGAVLVSGQDIRKVTQHSLRKNIAYVPQETSLFHRSIAENIAYGKPNATKAEIERAAELANADKFISDLPEGYDTLVGERGVKLSGGQRQRIAIARAILKDAPILVLDEATSALDSESEALIQDALAKLMKYRTSIVIAHRLSTVANLDRIVVLQDGKIVEQGRHHELLAKPKGVYRQLWERQSGAFME